MTSTASLNPKANVSVVQALQETLADSFVLYFKTHSFHWNVEGPHFHSLHGMFEEQYTEQWTALDEIAERIRALGEYAPMSYGEISRHAEMSETEKKLSAMDMVKTLAEDNLALVSKLQAATEIAQEAGDEATADLFIGRTTVHEKNAWMLNSTAKK